jgi:hypothetical protein
MKIKTLTLAAGLLIGAIAFAQEVKVQSLTEQLQPIKKDEKYKIFTMSSEGLVALGPAKPTGMKDAFSSDIVVSSVAFENDSQDIQGFVQTKSIVFSRNSGDVEATILDSHGDFPYYTKGKDRVNNDRIVLVIEGDIYFIKSLGYNDSDPSGVSGVDITEIISKNKLAGIKGDPKTIASYKMKVHNYISTIKTEGAKIIAAALEKQRKENSLEGRDVKSIELIMQSDFVTPGQNTKMGVIANLKDGSQLKTKGFAKGKTFWSDYKITVVGGSFDEKGNLTTSEEFDAANKDQITITIQSTYIPSLKITKSVNVNYARSYSFNFNQDGMYGNFGRTGTKGNCIKGKTAGDGGNGSNGSSGSNAGDYTVKITAYTHAQTKEALLKYELMTPSGVKHFVVTPASVVSINANGGNGGSGGSGGNSGDVSKEHSAGEPADCDCGASVTYMGRGGNGGNGGNGGSGGKVLVIVDPAVTAYELKVTAEAGFGGNAGSAGTSDAAGGCNGNSAVSKARESKKGTAGVAGKNGMKGTVTTKKEAVKLSW